MNDPATLDATALADLVRRGELTPIELVDAAIARIERLDPRLNAVVTPMFDQAREAAAGSLPEGPFRGVPFLLKDLGAEYAGARLTNGSAFLKDHISSRDSELVARYIRAGMIVLGKTNTSEFGLVPTAEPALFGPAHNPWNLSRSTGGSSGGSAAAVAAGVVPMAHASDGGGSIRIPASCCGLFGLKPTRGRITSAPGSGDAAGLAIEHAVTRSVRDSAGLLDATAGPAPGDPYFAAPPLRPYADEVGAEPGRLRIALSTKPITGIEVHPDCVAAANDAAALCAELGHEVTEAAPTVDGERMARQFGLVWVGNLGRTIRDLARRVGKEPAAEHFEPATWRAYLAGQNVSASDYLLAVQELRGLSRQIAAWFEDYDLWLTPTLAQPPVPLGYFAYSREQARQHRERLGHFTHFTLPCNVTGQPAASIPLYWNDEGLPIGCQFIAPYGDEPTILRIAAQLESARPWADRRPPLAE